MEALNLARKWRRKRFDDMIGQDIAMRMLKNSLYLNQLFPVYLFSGQRGCGKTSVARIFAAAINCENLTLFRQKPDTELVPCLGCFSCNSFERNEHPDFIEVDAASHTGVDHVRGLIESAALRPVLSSHKVYLIDEVHMLSKAACNALLKVLEEPPRGVIFILATTDPQKIIDTVKSRCFQLFFTPVKTEELSRYLAQICTAESIGFEQEALSLIAKESGGCVRDAINMLEQARFADEVVNCQTVVSVLGHLHDDQLKIVVSALLDRNAEAVLSFIANPSSYAISVEHVWRRLTEMVRALLWYKHGVKPAHLMIGTSIEDLAKKYEFSLLQGLLSHLYSGHDQLIKTALNQAWFEVLLLQWCHAIDLKNCSVSESSGILADSDSSVVGEPIKDEKMSVHLIKNEESKKNQGIEWNRFISELELLDDRLITSIFRQIVRIDWNREKKQLGLVFPENRIFFKDLLVNAEAIWREKIDIAFGSSITIQYLFEGPIIAESVPIVSVKKKDETGELKKVILDTKNGEVFEQKKDSEKQIFKQKNNFYKKEKQSAQVVVTISDPNKWPMASLLMGTFSGTLTEFKKGSNGVTN